MTPPQAACLPRLRHLGLKLIIPAQVFCMSWCADFEFRVSSDLILTHRPIPGGLAEIGLYINR